MGKLTLCSVGVLAEEKCAGNQLAAFRGGRAFNDGEMQHIAQPITIAQGAFIGGAGSYIVSTIKDGRHTRGERTCQ